MTDSDSWGEARRVSITRVVPDSRKTSRSLTQTRLCYHERDPQGSSRLYSLRASLPQPETKPGESELLPNPLVLELSARPNLALTYLFLLVNPDLELYRLDSGRPKKNLFSNPALPSAAGPVDTPRMAAWTIFQSPAGTSLPVDNHESLLFPFSPVCSPPHACRARELKMVDLVRDLDLPSGARSNWATYGFEGDNFKGVVRLLTGCPPGESIEWSTKTRRYLAGTRTRLRKDGKEGRPRS